MLATDPVLLIEDHDGVREALARLLQARGYKVVQCRDGKEGWEYLERGGCASVIVLDILMPRLDGRLFRKKQLDRKDCASIPVIVFTGTGEELVGVVGVIRKNDPEGLLRLIERTAGHPAFKE